MYSNIMNCFEVSNSILKPHSSLDKQYSQNLIYIFQYLSAIQNHLNKAAPFFFLHPENFLIISQKISSKLLNPKSIKISSLSI